VQEDMDMLRLPDELKKQKAKLFGLTITPERLSKIREQRRPGSKYASLRQCKLELDEVEAEFDSSNKQVQAVAKLIDDAILKSYKLWPTNYIAFDLLHKTDKFKTYYTDNEKSLFERRLEMKIDENNSQMVESFLAMYANPVVNKSKYNNAI
jgi:hypothetical protein